MNQACTEENFVISDSWTNEDHICKQLTD